MIILTNSFKCNWKPRNTEHFDCSLKFQYWVYLQLFLKWLMNNFIFSISQQSCLQVKTDDKISVLNWRWLCSFILNLCLPYFQDLFLFVCYCCCCFFSSHTRTTTYKSNSLSFLELPESLLFSLAYSLDKNNSLRLRLFHFLTTSVACDGYSDISQFQAFK